MRIGSFLGRSRKLKTIAGIPSYRRALRYGVAAATEHHGAPLPSDLRTVIDVGANRGQFALVARQRWPQSQLVCFEPLPGPRAALARVLRAHPRAEIVDAAAGAANGEATIHISSADDSSSLLPITERQYETFPGTEERGTLSVRTVTLDDHFRSDFERPALLKIDVQGYELEVLRGARHLVDRIDFVLVECSFVEFYRGQASAGEVVGFLYEHGFTLTGAPDATCDRRGAILQIDLLFSRRTAPAKNQRSPARAARLQ